MATTWGTIQQNETGTPPTPVILPLRANEARETTNQGVKTPPDRGPGGPGGNLQFAFPELPPTTVAQPSSAVPQKEMEPPTDGAPTAIWPECGRPATVRACAETAETIYQRLQPNSATILALTSPGDGDGKTSLMISLAPELAKFIRCTERSETFLSDGEGSYTSGRSPYTGGVLAVDADFRKADLSSRLVLSTGAATDGSTALIYPTNRPGLNVLPSWGGSCTAIPGATVQLSPQHRRRWNRDWFDDLRQRWPLVLLDTPSLEHAEAAPIMRYCDGVYLVVRLGHTARRAVAEAVLAIKARGGRLLGSVIVE